MTYRHTKHKISNCYSIVVDLKSCVIISKTPKLHTNSESSPWTIILWKMDIDICLIQLHWSLSLFPFHYKVSELESINEIWHNVVMDNVTLFLVHLLFPMNYLTSHLVPVWNLERRLMSWEYRKTGPGHMTPNVWQVYRYLFVIYQRTLSLHHIM
jgi:hypothetical protein